MFSKDLEYSIGQCYKQAREARHEFMTVEHLLLALLDNSAAIAVLKACGFNQPKLAIAGAKSNGKFIKVEAKATGKNNGEYEITGYTKYRKFVTVTFTLLEHKAVVESVNLPSYGRIREVIIKQYIEPAE